MKNNCVDKFEQLQNYLQQLGPIAVAVSGGVDSMTLAVIAHRCNPDTQVFHAASAAVPQQASSRIKSYAQREAWQLQIIDAGELQNSEYVANPVNRCYFCKSQLYSGIQSYTQHAVLSGTNTDDLGDYRPGLQAAAQRQVIHPYVEVGVSKAELRGFAKQLKLNDLYDLPASPCLSSRVETGIAIAPNLLKIIDEVEITLWQKLSKLVSVSTLRCRRRASGVVVELDVAEPLADELEGQIKAWASDIFTQHQQQALAAKVSVESYRRGSAFLIDSVSVE